MKFRRQIGYVLVWTVLAAATTAFAQQRGTPPPPPAAPPPQATTAPPPPPPPPPPPQGSRQASANARTLRVDVVLSRTRDGKTISRVPYSLLVNASELMNERTSLRVGVDVPTGREQTSKTGDNAMTQSEFRYLGTRIDCSATVLQDGTYKVWINLQDSSLVPLDADPRAVNAHRQYSVSNNLIVRDGVALQFSVGTDQLTGETTRAELTVTAVK